jgi:putative multiple sugar transport system permease protein
VGGVIGGAQGWFVAYLKIPSFIVTLAGMLVFKGLALALLQGQSVGPFPETFQLLSSGFIPDFSRRRDARISSLVIGAVVWRIAAIFSAKARARGHVARRWRRSRPRSSSPRTSRSPR